MSGNDEEQDGNTKAEIASVGQGLQTEGKSLLKDVATPAPLIVLNDTIQAISYDAPNVANAIHTGIEGEIKEGITSEVEAQRSEIEEQEEPPPEGKKSLVGMVQVLEKPATLAVDFASDIVNDGPLPFAIGMVAQVLGGLPIVTHFTPVVGVDVHIVEPPPKPVPFVYVGFVFDHLEYLNAAISAICSIVFDIPSVKAAMSNAVLSLAAEAAEAYFGSSGGNPMLINGLMRATAGTHTYHIPGMHFPLMGVMFTDPVRPIPISEGTSLMGSATVSVNGDPLSYMGLPALSCWFQGLPIAPPRNSQHQPCPGMKLPTAVMVPIPPGRPVLVGGVPTVKTPDLSPSAIVDAAMSLKVVSEFMDAVKGAAKDTVKDTVTGVGKDVAKSLKDFLEGAEKDSAKDLKNSLENTVKDSAKDFKDSLKIAEKDAKNNLENAAKDLKNTAKDLINDSKNATSNIEKALDKVHNIYNKEESDVKDSLKKIITDGAYNDRKQK